MICAQPSISCGPPLQYACSTITRTGSAPDGGPYHMDICFTHTPLRALSMDANIFETPPYYMDPRCPNNILDRHRTGVHIIWTFVSHIGLCEHFQWMQTFLKPLHIIWTPVAQTIYAFTMQVLTDYQRRGRRMGTRVHTNIHTRQSYYYYGGMLAGVCCANLYRLAASRSRRWLST